MAKNKYGSRKPEHFLFLITFEHIDSRWLLEPVLIFPFFSVNTVTHDPHGDLMGVSS